MILDLVTDRLRVFLWALSFVFPLECGQNRFDVRGAAPTAGAISSAPAAGVPPHQPLDAAPVAADALLPALQAESWLIALPVEGFRDARVSVPLGAREARPVVVALHGAGDRPEWACGSWRGVTDAYPFVLCPTGEPGGLPDGFVWGNDSQVEREVKASIDALRRRFGDHVAAGCSLLTGFSQGAIRMAPMLARGGGWCPQAVLCEGAYDALGKDFARAFVRWGGRRLLLGCSQSYCARIFRAREARLAAERIDVKTVYSGERTHNLNAEMVRTLHEAWPWLVRDDDRWSSFARSLARERKAE